jgi:hypothetical protein
MRKNIVPVKTGRVETAGDWLDLGELAEVEISSEDPSHPIEAALQPNLGPGWRAAEPGRQTIRLLFDEPQRVRRIQLQVNEEHQARTQELVLRWSDDRGKNYREIVRQQYNFTPSGSTTEREEYTLNLSGVTALELEITPDISHSAAKASLARLRVG